MPIDPALLQKIALLRDFPAAELAELAAAAMERKMARREVLLQKGEQPQFLPILLDGRLQGIDFTLDGREVGLYFVGVGEFCGELSLIDRLPMAETVIALAPSRLLLLPREQARVMMFSAPGAAEKLALRLAGRLRAVASQRLLLALSNPMQRLCAQLLQMARETESRIESSVLVIPSAPTHQEIAIMINMSRETVTRAFQQLQNQEVLRRDGSQLLILNVRQLEVMASGE